MIDFIGLKLIVFHDLPLNKIEIHHQPKPKLLMEISIFKEESDDYTERILVFGDLAHLNPEIILVKDYSDAEIYSFDYHLEGELFFGKMTCLIGSGKPSFEIDFSCRSVEVINIETESNN